MWWPRSGPGNSLAWETMPRDNKEVGTRRRQRAAASRERDHELRCRDGAYQYRSEFLLRKLCLRGHRKAVSLILDFLASGWSIPKTLENEPGLEASEILACIAHDAEMSRRHSVETGG